jgi:gamma-glutamylcyclotransferase (GGCT)/AIG2-like uncharacterized protein YtfP
VPTLLGQRFKYVLEFEGLNPDVIKMSIFSISIGATMEYLFSYGTLQLKSVQVANFGRELIGSSDTLLQYIIEQVEITDARVLEESGQRYHPILKFTGNTENEVEGTVFEVTAEDLAKADVYEVSDYKRVSAHLKSGIDCWVYVSAV